MKISGLMKKAVTALEHAAQAEVKKIVAQAKRELAKDGFEIARKAPVSLGAANSAASNGDYVKSLYRDLLGREPDLDGYMSHMNGLAAGMSRDSIRDVFLNSPEYREKQAAAANKVETPAAPAAPAPQTLGPVPLEGFDAGKLADFSHQTVKYQFGRVATHYSLDSVKDKAGAEALLNKMVPDLRAAGLDIRGVKGDRLLMKTPLGLESIDVVRGAGSGNPGWWWGADGTVATPAEVAGFPPLAASPAPAPTPAPNPNGLPPEPGQPLSTVPMKAEYKNAPIDKSSPSAAARSAAQWVKDTHPELFGLDDRQVAFQVMTQVIGALRAAGYDATRVVNHTDRAVGDGWRYGSDAVVVDGRVFDVYGNFGSPGGSNVQSLDVGPYEAGRQRE